IKDYRNERIDIRYRRECEIKIDELKEKFNGMSININKKKEFRQLKKEANVIYCNHTRLTDYGARGLSHNGDEHLRTILEKELDEFIKSSVEDLVPIPSESVDLSDIESECDKPFCDDFITFSNPLFDSNDNFTSSDDESTFQKKISKFIRTLFLMKKSFLLR
ncbi:hypothetical protein Tco_1423941, partial [Tanacetum coccineum]